MKINSIGINVYRQAIAAQPQDNKSSVKLASRADDNARVLLPGQDVKAPSRLAVKLPRGVFADLLTPEESEAIKMVFQKYDLSSDRPSTTDPARRDSHLGNNVDVRL
jgi:hypothetical protein